MRPTSDRPGSERGGGANSIFAAPRASDATLDSGRGRSTRASGFVDLRRALRPSDRRELPSAVLSKIEQQEWSSEVLMRMVQIGIVTAFGILYFVAPRTDTGTRFTLVPQALATYLALTLLGLAWSWHRKLPDWAAYLSIGFDIGLLMLLIWSFHLQYEQPASFYLKAPTFLYVFIFITLRAFRFEPKFVVAAGLATITAWLIMVGLVVVFDRTGTVVTHDYVQYLTSNSLLVGAEIDKLLCVAVVTGVLFLVLRRSRTLLVQAVSEQTAAANLSRFFDEPVATRIRFADDLSAQGLRREAAVLFVDLRGFTRLSAEMEPTEVIQMIVEYQRRIVPIIRTHSGVIDKFMGDGIMATFGALEESTSYAADALSAVDAIMADAEAWPGEESMLQRLPPRSVGAAVAAGTIILGAVGDASRLEFTVIGAPVNLAAKLETWNKTVGSRALTTTATYNLAVEQGYAASHQITLIERQVEGFAGKQSLAVLHA